MTGRLLVGTSGFSYPGWVPRFYPAGLRAGDLLRSYASRLPAVEINNTFYRQPRPEMVASWLAATPADFRFVIKAQRGGTMRSFADPVGGLDWLTGPYRAFGERLGAVLFRVPDNLGRDDERLARFLDAWPRDLPLVMELRDPSWQADDVDAALRAHGAARCLTELPDDERPPDVRRTAGHLYLRLRRHDYSEDELRAWWNRLEPFLSAGDDAFVFFRHDEVGRGGELALALASLGAAAGFGREAAGRPGSGPGPGSG